MEKCFFWDTDYFIILVKESKSGRSSVCVSNTSCLHHFNEQYKKMIYIVYYILLQILNNGNEVKDLCYILTWDVYGLKIRLVC